MQRKQKDERKLTFRRNEESICTFLLRLIDPPLRQQSSNALTLSIRMYSKHVQIYLIEQRISENLSEDQQDWKLAPMLPFTSVVSFVQPLHILYRIWRSRSLWPEPLILHSRLSLFEGKEEIPPSEPQTLLPSLRYYTFYPLS